MARELAEETGLTAAWIVQEVGHGARFTTSDGRKNYLATTFIVEVDEIGKLEYAGAGNPLLLDQEDQAALALEAESGADIEEPVRPKPKGLTSLDQIPIKLSDAEHSRFIWATEEVVEKAEYNGDRLTYVSNDMKKVLLQAFQLQKHIMAAKANI